MSEPDYESFNMDKEYEGGQFSNGEFYYLNEKKKRKMTKDEAIYGSFLQDMQDSDGDESNSKKKGKDKMRQLQINEH